MSEDLQKSNPDLSISALRRLRLPDDEDIFWYRDDLHQPYPISALGMTTIQKHIAWGFQVGAENAMAPSKGAHAKVYKGKSYLGFDLIQDRVKLVERKKRNEEFIAHCKENWDEFYQKLINEVKDGLDNLAGVDADRLTTSDLLSYLIRSEQISRRNWEIHFILFYPANIIYLEFEDFCKRHGVAEENCISMLKGFDSMAAKTDGAMWRLAQLAEELGIGDMLLAEESAAALGKLKEISGASRWLDALEQFLKIYGNRLSAAHLDLFSLTWREDPTPVIETIKSFIPRVHTGWDIQDERNETMAKAKQATDQFFAGLTNEEEKEKFTRLLEATRKIYHFQEDHNFYIDMGSTAALHNTAMACGKRLQKYGLLESLEDVVFLTYSELTEVLSDLALNEKIALHHFGRLVPGLVRERKTSWEEVGKTKEAPLTLGPVPRRMTDPIGMKVFGIIDDTVYPKDEGEITGKLKGFPAAPGIVEGVARVVTSFEDFPKLKVREILVCASTTTAWTSLFLKIAGVVTDTGGMLSHTAIAAGEYGVPAVVGTWNATRSIRDGDIIRVDGNKGMVEVIKRAVD